MAAIIGGAVGSSIPNIFGGFAPFPNTIATALLAYQSEAIGFGFGIKFQYSKRLVGALTNAEFNTMTPIDIGNIVEAHNTELIQRMKNEMPKWLDIQRDFIEASVSVEIAKAERTPSAWAEIIMAFSGAAGQQIADSLNALDPAALGAILSSNPILALIYSFANTSGGTTPPPSDPGAGPAPLPTHDPDEDPFHPVEEHDENTQLILEATFKQFIITISGSNGSFTFTTIEGNLAQHRTVLSNNFSDVAFLIPERSLADQTTLRAEYRDRVENFYKVTI